MGRRDESFPARRRFLKQTVAAGGTGVLMILAEGSNGFSDAEPGSAAPSDRAPESQGYRLTDHIRAYYDTTRS